MLCCYVRKQRGTSVFHTGSSQICCVLLYPLKKNPKPDTSTPMIQKQIYLTQRTHKSFSGKPIGFSWIDPAMGAFLLKYRRCCQVYVAVTVLFLIVTTRRAGQPAPVPPFQPKWMWLPSGSILTQTVLGTVQYPSLPMQLWEIACLRWSCLTLLKCKPRKLLDVDKQRAHRSKILFSSPPKIHGAVLLLCIILKQWSHPYIGLFSP